MAAPAPEEPAGDPSMEDILASIRRILNDGDGETAAVPQGAPATAPSNVAPPAAAEGVFLLDQTMLIEDPAPMPQPPAPHPIENHQPEPPPEPPHDYSHLDAGELPAEPLMAPGAAAATTASLGALVRVVSQKQTPVYRGGPTLEDMVRDEIRPLVKAWLDENLPPMVERMVRTEIDRVTNRNG